MKKPRSHKAARPKSIPKALRKEPWQLLEGRARKMTAELIQLLDIIEKKVDEERVVLKGLLKTFDA